MVPSEPEGTLTPSSGTFHADNLEEADSDNNDNAGQEHDLERHETHLSRIQSIKQNLGERPACFKSTLQEVSFVAQATIAMSTSSFLVGASSIVTVTIGRDLAMSQGEISWISAAVGHSGEQSSQFYFLNLSPEVCMSQKRRKLYFWIMSGHSRFSFSSGSSLTLP